MQSMLPMPPGQVYPGYVPLPPQPAKRSAKRGTAGRLIGALVAVVVVAACAGGLYLYGKNAPNTPPGLVPGDLTPTASLAPGMNLIYSDSLSGKATGWASDANCSAHPDGYHIVNGYICYAPTGELNDADITVTATQIGGETTEVYGLVLRRASKGNYYSFDIDSDSKWAFLRCESARNTCEAVVPVTANAAIHSGLNVSNTLEVRAKGSHFDFFVNETKVGQADDARFSSGLLGISGVDSGEVVYTNILVTQPSGS